MHYKTIGLGLGIFSIALGAVELFGARRLSRALDAEGYEGLIQGFGARELVAGLGLVTAPANASHVWSRVAGDAMDLAALGAAARMAPRNRAVWGGFAFVIGTTILDVIVARGLESTTGKAVPIGG